jgi:hypothetical protein
MPSRGEQNDRAGKRRPSPPIRFNGSSRKGKGLQDMLPGCRLMLVVCLSALVCGWFFLMLSAVLPAPALVAP